MTITTTLVDLLNEVGVVASTGKATHGDPIIFAPIGDTWSDDVQNARVKVWVSEHPSSASTLRLQLPLKPVKGKFSQARVHAQIAALNGSYGYGTLRAKATRVSDGVLVCSDVSHFIPYEGDRIVGLHEVLIDVVGLWERSGRTLHRMKVAADSAAELAAMTADCVFEDDEPTQKDGTTRETKAEKPQEKKGEHSIESILAEMDTLIGLAPVKHAVRRLMVTQKVAKERAAAGLRSVTPSPHLVFTGNPGTGKTTIARMIGRLYKSLGLLPSGHVVEVGRSDLVGGYVGQTALKTKSVCESALGGVLFIDEAYSLHGGFSNDYGHEAVETLLTFMESHRGDLAVVVAGYPDEMATFIDMNPGLKSRFDYTLDFPDYSTDELLDILLGLFEAHDYQLHPRVPPYLNRLVARLPRGAGFGNARDVRRLFHDLVTEHAMALSQRDTYGPSDLWFIRWETVRRYESMTRPKRKEFVTADYVQSGYL